MKAKKRPQLTINKIPEMVKAAALGRVPKTIPTTTEFTMDVAKYVKGAQASTATDPLADLFKGIPFQKAAHRTEAADRARSRIKASEERTFQRAAEMYTARRRELEQRLNAANEEIQRLHAAIRQINRNHAEQIISAISVPQYEVAQGMAGESRPS